MATVEENVQFQSKRQNGDVVLQFPVTKMDNVLGLNGVLSDVVVSGQQTTTSSADGGTNVYTFTDKSGQTSVFNVKNGSKGSKGDKGDTGSAGSDGNGISSISVTYQSGTSATSAPTGTWSTIVPTVTAGNYLWTKVVFNYTNGTSSNPFYSVARQGSNGTNGTNGTNGNGISSIEIRYATSTSNTTAPSTWYTSIQTAAAGSYLWTRVRLLYTNGNYSDPYYTVARQGANGSSITGQRGSKWYTGMAMSGTSTTTGAYTWNDSEQKYVGDMYLNTSNGNVYKCTTSGTYTTAKWTYQGCIKGESSELPLDNWNSAEWSLNSSGRFTGEPDGSINYLEGLTVRNLYIPDVRGDHDLLTISITEYIKGIVQALARGVYKLSAASQNSIPEGWVCVKNDTGNTVSTVNGYTGANLAKGHTYIIYMYYTNDEYYDVICDLS